MALCVWPCNCYEKHHRSEPDLRWDLDLYARLDLAEAPGHLKEDLKAKWREIKTGLGYPPAGSSPARQEALGLNEDLTLRPKKSEGAKLREE